MSESPTQRTLKKLRDDGWMAQVVERWNPHARIRQDLFGVIDVLAIKGNETLAIQATTGSATSNRLKKVVESDCAWRMIEAGWRVEVWGWRKLKNRPGGKLWFPDIRVIE
jgi:hypothetical protein